MSTDLGKIQGKIKARHAGKSEKQILSEDAYMLMAGYLSEIERIQKQVDLNKKELASMIKVSASYLSQVFNGDKPLNFYTIARIQVALKIRFRVSVIHLQKDAPPQVAITPAPSKASVK